MFRSASARGLMPPLASDISSDGKAIAFIEGGVAAGGQSLAYLPEIGRIAAGSDRSRLLPRVIPNGQWLACIGSDKNPGVTLIPIGVGDSRTLPISPLAQVFYVRWLPDSQRLILAGVENGKLDRIYLLGIDGTPPAPVGGQTLPAAPRRQTSQVVPRLSPGL